MNPQAAGDPGTFEFSYKASANECQDGEAAGGNATGGKGEAVKAELTGLVPNTVYTVCLRAHNEAGEESELTAPVTFTTLVAPLTVESESSSVVDATEARLEASIYDGNFEATYHFEYGTSAGSYEVSVPRMSAHIHAALAPRSVSAAATGLAPATTYHYRVVASNVLPGEVDGPDREFTTPAAAPSTGSSGSCENEHLREEQPYGPGLPDCRAYEMVSPPETNGNDATSRHAEVAARASEAKELEPAITYSSKGAFGDPGGALVENQYLSRRSSTGWSTQAVAPLSSTPVTTFEGSSGEELESAYQGAYFTPELTAGLAVTSARLGEAPALSVDYHDLYVAQFAGGTYRYVDSIDDAGENPPWGASTDLERVVLSDKRRAS